MNYKLNPDHAYIVVACIFLLGGGLRYLAPVLAGLFS